MNNWILKFIDHYGHLAWFTVVAEGPNEVDELANKIKDFTGYSYTGHAFELVIK